MIARVPYTRLWEELSASKAMVFLAGPRQAGKTTFAKACSGAFANRLYFNWDIPAHKAKLIRSPTFFTAIERRDDTPPLVVLDEIHKYRQWKNYLKGVYDEFHETYRFLVSGSGRLDIRQRGGDSLAGRYFLMHLWPLTLAELGGRQRDFEAFIGDPLHMPPGEGGDLEGVWRRIESVSGFPEPYVANSPRVWQRWSDTYGRQVIREDIRDLVVLNDVQAMESLFALLPFRVGSPLSLNALAEDLKVAYNTVKAWIELFERFFLVIRIAPWAAGVARAIRKERKLYLFNTPLIENPAARFENAVALELFRAVSNWNEAGYGPFELRYVRNKEKQEVDFLIVFKRRPFLLVEAKLKEREPAKSLRRFQAELDIPAVQVVSEGATYRRMGEGRQAVLVTPAWRWLALLP